MRSNLFLVVDLACDDVAFPMDASYWNEAGHQYSTHKQWWPLPDRI